MSKGQGIKERLSRRGVAALMTAVTLVPVVAGCAAGDAEEIAPSGAPPSTSQTTETTNLPRARPPPNQEVVRAGKPLVKLPTLPHDPLAKARANDAFKGVQTVARRNVAPGVSYERIQGRTTGGSPIVGHVLVLDLNREGIQLRTTRPNERGMTTTAFSKKVDALVAINAGAWETAGPHAGDFFPRGLFVGQGEHFPQTMDSKKDTFLACTDQGKCITDGQNVMKNAPKGADHIVNGWGSMLVQEGKANFNYAQQEPTAHTDARHPRTAFAVTESGKLVALMIEGRQARSVGATYAEMANLFTSPFFRKDPIVSAIQADGGGSSTVVVGGERIDRPYDGTERPVSTHLAVVRSSR
jgi:hypothetical protein